MEMVSIVKNYTGTRGTSQASMVPPPTGQALSGATQRPGLTTGGASALCPVERVALK